MAQNDQKQKQKKSLIKIAGGAGNDHHILNHGEKNNKTAPPGKKQDNPKTK